MAQQIKSKKYKIQRNIKSARLQDSALEVSPKKKPSAVQLIQGGLKVAEFDRLQQQLGVSSERLSELLRLGKSTLHRRRQTGRLTKDESDKVVRFQRLFEQAVSVLSDPEEARDWLKAEAYGLNGVTPLDHADTEAGAREVESLLWRLEHGVYS